MDENEVGIVYDKSPSPPESPRLEPDEKVGIDYSNSPRPSTYGQRSEGGETPGMDYYHPMSNPPGLEEVEINLPILEPYINSPPPPPHSMTLKDAVSFIRGDVVKAFDGRIEELPSVLGHWAKTALDSEFVDESVKSQVKTFLEESQSIDKESAQVFLGKLVKFIDSLKFKEEG